MSPVLETPFSSTATYPVSCKFHSPIYTSSKAEFEITTFFVSPEIFASIVLSPSITFAFIHNFKLHISFTRKKVLNVVFEFSHCVTPSLEIFDLPVDSPSCQVLPPIGISCELASSDSL